ncbi:hypothetical protein C8B47_03715 [filamentous cyanobacterium CCP4]|nr:hypothetical protein C8B47_03715 [filamentous cyanobacterium CCP4]
MMLGVEMADWGYAEENDNKRKNLWGGFLLFVILCPVSLLAFLWWADETMGSGASDEVVIPSITAVETDEEDEMPTPTLSDADLIRNKLERDVPLATITHVVVTDYSDPPIIQVTIDVFSGDQRDLTLFQMQDIVCALKEGQWDGYRYRLAARLPSGPAGIIMAIEPDVIEQLICDGTRTINWENATSEYFIINSLR